MVRPWYWPKGGQPDRAEEFTWIVKNKFAASWWPDPPVFKRYEKEGIKVIINCSEFDNKSVIPKNFKYYHINVPDYGLPSDDQVRRFIEITDIHGQKNEAIVAHCVAGCGRTGQFAVAWAAHNGYIPKGMDPVKWIRKLRPCSLESKEQEDNARNLARKHQISA